MNGETTVTEEIKDALTDNQHSIDEKVHGSPFAIVALSYFAILAAACLGIAAIVWLM